MTDIRKIDKFLQNLEGVRRSGNGKWTAKCPAHADRSPSLSLKETPIGGVLLYCFAGCQFGDILAALGMTASDCFVRSDFSTRSYRIAAVRHEIDAEIEVLQERYGLSVDAAKELASIGRIRNQGGKS